MTEPSSAQGAISTAERFAAVLGEAGWVLTNSTWREDIAFGINVEAVLERPRGKLYMHYVPEENRISVTIADDEDREVVEFGFGIADSTDMETALQSVIAVQNDVSPRALPALLLALYEGGREMNWEVQGEAEEAITLANVEDKSYRRPLP